MHARRSKKIAEPEAFCEEEWEKIPNTRTERIFIWQQKVFASCDICQRSVTKYWICRMSKPLHMPQWCFYCLNFCSIYDIKSIYAWMIAENIVFYVPYPREIVYIFSLKKIIKLCYLLRDVQTFACSCNYEIVLLMMVLHWFLCHLHLLIVPVWQTEGFKNIYILFIYRCCLYRFFKLCVSS